MRFTKGKIVTHVAAVGIGVLIAAAGGSVIVQRQGEEKKGISGGGAGTVEEARPERKGRPDVTKAMPRGPQKPRLSSREYRAAWEAIGRRNLTKQERLQLQNTVLRQWMEVDPEAAMKAFLALPWDEMAIPMFAFQGYFAKNPIEAWDLLNSGRLGLGASMLKGQWAQSVVREHPELVLSQLREFRQDQQKDLLMTIAGLMSKDPARREEFIDKLCAFPEDKQTLDWIKSLAPMLGTGETPAALREKLAAADSPQRTTLYLHQFGLALKDTDMEAIRAEWSQLPAELKERAVRAITLHTDPDGTKNTPGLFTMLVEAKQWDFLNTERWRLGRYAQTPEKKEELAKWALTLPEDPGTQEIFHRAVDPFIRADLDKGGAWVETLPKGWQRDRALAELSQQALYRKGSTELSDWALNEIADPKLKADATKWRGDWAKKQK